MTPGFRRLQDIAIIIFKARYIKLDKSYMDIETLLTFLFLDTAQQLTGEIASPMENPKNEVDITGKTSLFKPNKSKLPQ